MRLSPFAVALCLLAGCGGRINPPDYPEQITGVEADGSLILQRGMDNRVRHTFSGRIDRVFGAVVSVYSELGIEPTLIDRKEYRYGNVGFVFPNPFAGGRTNEYFDCGADVIGQLAGRGRLLATVVTTLTAVDSTTTVAATQVTGALRRPDGTSTRPVNCASTGKMEETLRTAIAGKLK